MRTRSSAAIVVVTAAVIAGALWLAGSDGITSQRGNDQEQGRQAAPERQRKKDRAQPSPAVRSLAFDVERKNHRLTSRYLLEVTSSSGQVATHDLKKPKWRRGTIAVPLPELPPGKYVMVVVAEGRGAKARSLPIEVTIP